MLKHHDQKQVGEKRVYSVSLKEVRTGIETGQNLEAGADTDTMEGCCLLACSPWLAHPVFL